MLSFLACSSSEGVAYLSDIASTKPNEGSVGLDGRMKEAAVEELDKPDRQQGQDRRERQLMEK